MGRPRITPRLIGEVAREIDARAGARVRAVHQDGPVVIRLDLRDDERHDLVVALDPVLPRVCFARPRKAPASPSALAGALRKQLVGARVEGVDTVRGERVLAVRFRRGEERRTLWVELFGGQANWYLLDDEDRVLWTLKGDVAARRDSSKGARFEPVPPREPEADEDAAPDGARGSEAVHALWRAARGARDDTSGGARLRKVLKAHAKRARKAATTLEQALGELERADELERKGELLRGAFHLLQPGLAEVRVPDYAEDPPVEVRVELDPTKPPGDQVAHCFARARRLRRAAKEARSRHREAPALLAALENALEQLAPGSEAEQDLAAFVESLPASAQADARNALREPGAVSTKQGPKTAQPWRSYTSADGWTILVGKDARANDELTMRKAKPQDLFLHVRAATGSHVIVPTPRGKTVPRETLLDAAELACHFSTRRKAERNEVDYTPRRYVRKPKGSPAGLVALERSKTLTLRRDEDRRARLLGSKQA